MKTHYENLRVAENAPDEVIKAAYRALSQKYHPDKNNGSKDFEWIMQIINSSYAVLSNPEKRRLYDDYLKQKRTPAEQADLDSEAKPDESTERDKQHKDDVDSSEKNEGKADKEFEKRMYIAAGILFTIPIFIFIYVIIEDNAVYFSAAENSSKNLTINNIQNSDAATTSQIEPNSDDPKELSVATETQPTNQGFVLIPSGNFQMGDAFKEGAEEERPTHSVYVSSFYIQAQETTKWEWDAVRRWALANGYDFSVGNSTGVYNPVDSVNWYDVVKWCNARSELEGLTPCYHTNLSQTAVYRTGQEDLTNKHVDWEANGYRLPTESEWEKAARGGLDGKRFPWGDILTESDHDKLNGYNGYGLKGLVGNILEWCWDRYDAEYYALDISDGIGGPSSPPNRVYRGGAWADGSFNCRLAGRNRSDPSRFERYIGFRPVRTIGSVP
jgi:formylglycine-generating enzyme required for sulfatase activity